MKKILFCTPSHDGSVAVDYLRGCLDVNKKLHGTDFYVDFFWQEHGSDVVKAREAMLWFWYHETEHDYMLFMDADQGFTAQTIAQLFVTAEKTPMPAVVAAPVPLKEIKESRVIDYIVSAISDEESPFNVDGMLSSTYDYNFAGDHLLGDAKGDIAAVEKVGTGCMLIHRSVVDKIVEASSKEGGDMTGCDPYESKVTKKTCFTMFTHLIMGGKILGEDYSFCIRMLINDIPVLVDLRCNLTHHGSFAFKGDFQEKRDYLKHLKKVSDKTAK